MALDRIFTDPNNPEVMLIAGALLKPALAAEAAPFVEPDDFKDERLGKIWGVMVGMINAGEAAKIDTVSIGKRFPNASLEAQRNIALFCDKLMDEWPKVTSLVLAAHRVRRRATMRLALDRMREIAGMLKDEIESNDGSMPDLDEKLAGLSIAVTSRSDTEKRRVTVKDLASQVTAYFDQLYTGSSNVYVPTGIPKLDDFLGGGLRPGQLHVILGGTGSGKTALSSQIADHAVSRGRNAIMFSMEVDPLDVFVRDMERRAGVSRWDLRRLDKRDNAIKKLATTIGRSVAEDGKIVFGEPISTEGIRQAILTERLRSGQIDLVVVDHAQVALPSKSDKRSMPRYLEVKNTAEGLRALARQLGVAVVLTAQMNPVQKGETPNMSLVREGKDINNAAEVVMMIHHEKTEMMEGEMVIAHSWIIVEKARAGREGKVEVRYNGALFRFEEPSVSEWDNPA
jgi:replicative DNA helicase